MSDKKISELDAITGANTATDDFFIVVDTSGSATKKISRAELTNSLEAEFNQLNSNLNLNGNNITGTGNINVTGNIVATGTTGGVAKLSLVAEEVHGEIEGINIGNNFGGLAFKTNSNGTTAERMRINSSGRVGISTTAPSSTFQVGDGSADTRGTFNPNTAFAIGVKNGSNHGGFIGSGGANVIQFSSSAGAERMRIDSSGRLGIATSAPATTLHVNGGAMLDGITVIGRNQTGYDSAGAEVLIDANSGTSPMAWHVGGSEVARINGNGRLGLGTTSVSSRLHLKGDAYTALTLDGTAGGQLDFYRNGSRHAQIFTDNAGGDIIFRNNTTTERMRIDSGNLHVGKTTSGIGTAGLSLRGDVNIAQFTRDGNPPLDLSRLTNDGDIVLFRKDSTTVGSIGTTLKGGVNEAYFGTGDTGLYYRAQSDAITPCTTAGGSDRDNAIDLGFSSIRFDDIYATNGTIQTSDQQEKNTITDSDLGLDFINRLSPKSYIFNGKTRTHYGLIAQDVETVLGDISKPTSGFAGFIKSDISDEQDGSEYRYGLRYTEFVGPLIQAIKDLKAENDAMRARLDALEAN